MLFLLPLLLVLERVYFVFADRYNIIDKPNQRSSHSYITRRGGGILFPAAWLLFFIASGFSMPWFTAGLVLISLVSFVDDLGEVAVLPRISTHAVALYLMFIEFGITNMLPGWGIAVALFCGIAILNAVNFMDGINGITSMYAIVFWGVVAWASGQDLQTAIFNTSGPLNYILASLVVFSFYNFRKQARCFAGDVGSVSMAYLMIGALVPLVFGTGSYGWTEVSDTSAVPVIHLKYLLLLAVYGADSFLTIVHRLYLRENILKGHRKHLYQYMANEAGMKHLTVSMVYAGVQLAVSIWVVVTPVNWMAGISLLTVLSLVYAGSKWYILNTLPFRIAPSVTPVHKMEGSSNQSLPKYKPVSKTATRPMTSRLTPADTVLSKKKPVTPMQAPKPARYAPGRAS